MGDERRGGRFRSGVSRLHDLDSVSDTGTARLAKSGADSNLRAGHAYLLPIFFRILSFFFLDIDYYYYYRWYWINIVHFIDSM